MKLIILLIVILVCCGCDKNSSELMSSSKEEYETGKKEMLFSKDTSIKKDDDKIRLGKCTTLVDNNDPTNFYEYDYIGELDNKLQYKIIRQTTYNGNTSLIIDMKSCKRYSLPGIPHKLGSLFVNFNESETTDRKQVIQIWRVSQDSLKKIKDVSFKENVEFVELRFTPHKLLLKDHRSIYWALTL